MGPIDAYLTGEEYRRRFQRVLCSDLAPSSLIASKISLGRCHLRKLPSSTFMNKTVKSISMYNHTYYLVRLLEE